MMSKVGLIVAARVDSLLVELLDSVTDKDQKIPWSALTERPKNALRRALEDSGHADAANSKAFSFNQIRHLTIGDLKDQRNVGKQTLNDIVQQLNEAFVKDWDFEDPESNLDLQKQDEVDPQAIDELQVIRQRIQNSRNLEELAECMLEYQVAVNDIDSRDIDIWKSRLPWFTDNPMTLAKIASKYGLTRERVRQIQNKAERYPFDLDGPVKILQEFQNLLLMTTSYSEFEEECKDAELVTSDSLSPGRIRQIAIVLGNDQLVQEMSNAIHAWNRMSIFSE